jgi:hypothetical protein
MIDDIREKEDDFYQLKELISFVYTINNLAFNKFYTPLSFRHSS